MVISKPCKHPDCPPRDGYTRGEYESIEFIREIPTPRRRSLSRTSSPLAKGPSASSLPTDNGATDGQTRKSSADVRLSDGRTRGKTISFAEPRGDEATGNDSDQSEEAGDEDESNPVEWVMITRSDPGGNVPRFMVERGSPSAIVSDAGKFLDWACKRTTPIQETEAVNESTGEPATERVEHEKDIEAYQTNGHLVGLDGNQDNAERATASVVAPATKEGPLLEPPSGILSSVTSAAYAGFETYAPQSIIDRLPVRKITPSIPTAENQAEGNVSTISSPRPPSVMSSATSVASFASADSHLSSPNPSLKSTNLSGSSLSKVPSSVHDRELAKLAARKQKLDAKLLKTREKETKNKVDLTSKEVDRLRKAEEKHAREIVKAEEKHAKEVAALQAKRAREEAKAVEKLKRAQDKDEKARLLRERGEAREELEMVKAERDILMARIGDLERENTGLMARLSKVEGGEALLEEVRRAGSLNGV